MAYTPALTAMQLFRTGISNSGNARAWGQFSGSSKGNTNYLDSYTWIESTLSGIIELTAIDGMTDSDADNVSDYEEICVGGTDPDNPDSDGDGVNDDIDMCVGDDTYGDNNGDGICDPPTCDDGVMNGDETDIDCGGGLCLACALGDDCALSSDCSSGRCDLGVCEERFFWPIFFPALFYDGKKVQ